MNKSLFFFVQLFVLISIQNNELLSQKHELYVEFSIEKTEYVEDEPIIINYKITNNGNTKEVIPYTCDVLYDVFENLIIQNEKGEKFTYNGVMVDCFGGELILHPNDYITTDENNFFGNGMDLFFGFGEIKSNFSWGHHYLPEGKYTINFYRFINNDIKALTNNVTFNIKKPGLKEGFNKITELFLMHDDSAKFDCLRKYIYDYPESGYLNLAFGDYVRLRGFRTISIKDFIGDFNYFIDKRINLWSIYNYLKYCSDAINEVKGEDKMINYLVNIMNKYPGSKVSHAAEKLLLKVIPNEIYLKGLKN